MCWRESEFAGERWSNVGLEMRGNYNCDILFVIRVCQKASIKSNRMYIQNRIGYLVNSINEYLKRLLVMLCC